MTSTAQTQTVVKFSDTFYLKHESGQYLIAADRGRHNWPQLGNTGKVALQLVGSKDEVTANSYIKIRTTESATRNNDVLGAFGDSHNCYYWRDGYDDGKQGWRITKASGNSGPIHYGEKVYITNIAYHEQRLTPDTRNQGYVTTVKNARSEWILESTEALSANELDALDSKNVFAWSVASGDPTESGVILWTRVNPEIYDGTTPLKYQVSQKPDFQSVIVDGQVKASEFGEERDYTVHVDLDELENKLEPDTYYFYRFSYKDVLSPVGRCKTLPAADAEINKLCFAVLTCNDYSTGYFNAFYHLAAEDEIDFVIHLGDFIYEYPQYPPGYGEIVREDLTLENQQYPPKNSETGERATSLEHFRHIYQTYRQDPALQKAMERHTWIITLDDHEIADNCYWDYDKKTMGISVDEPPHPVYEHEKKPEVANKVMRQLFIEATQAWREYVPARVEKASDSEDPRYQLYRHFRFGRLMDFFLTDSRSYRDKPDLEINQQILEKAKQYQESHPNANISDAMTHARQEMNLPDWKASMLGKEQKEWLIDGLTNSVSVPLWKVWGNQTFLATALANEMMGEIDDWHGFKAERYEILQSVKDSQTSEYKPDFKSYFVVLTGDMHTSLIAYLKTETESLTSYLASGAVNNVGSGIANVASGVVSGVKLNWSEAIGNVGEGVKDLGGGMKNVAGGLISGIKNPLKAGENVFEAGKNNLNYDYSKLAGVEFMTPSLTSPGVSEGILKKIENAPPINIPETLEKLLPFTDNSIDDQDSWQHKLLTGNGIKSMSPHIEHFDSRVNGYAIAQFTREQMSWSVYRIDRTNYKKLDDGRNVSTEETEKELVQSATYNPNGIKLDD